MREEQINKTPYGVRGRFNLNGRIESVSRTLREGMLKTHGKYQKNKLKIGMGADNYSFYNDLGMLLIEAIKEKRETLDNSNRHGKDFATRKIEDINSNKAKVTKQKPEVKNN